MCSPAGKHGRFQGRGLSGGCWTLLEAYSWTAHGRYPTSTPGWWGGAHPLGLLDYTVIHNGEISSCNANRRFIEMFGYKCTPQTDTEVITCIADYLLRRQGLTLPELAGVIAAPFWDTIARMDEEKRKKATYLRTVFPSLLITGEKRVLTVLPNAYMQGRRAGENMAGGDAVFDDAIAMNTIGFFGLRSLTAGSCGVELYEQATAESVRRLYVEDGRLIGFILIGDVAGAGVYTSMTRNKTPIDSVNLELLGSAPSLAAFADEYRGKMLGEVV